MAIGSGFAVSQKVMDFLKERFGEGAVAISQLPKETLVEMLNNLEGMPEKVFPMPVPEWVDGSGDMMNAVVFGKIVFYSEARQLLEPFKEVLVKETIKGSIEVVSEAGKHSIDYSQDGDCIIFNKEKLMYLLNAMGVEASGVSGFAVRDT